MNEQDEIKARAAIERGAKAEKLLRDPFLVEALDTVHQALHDAIDHVGLRDTEGLVSLRLQLKALATVKGYLETALRDGKFAAEQIQRDMRRVPDLSDFRSSDWRARA